MKNKDDLTIADYQLLGQAYSNLIEAGLLLAIVEYDTFIEAVCTGDVFDFESALKEMDIES